ncbi:hypothetical protein [Proteiniphilum acetatigenes]|uniref:hypothetical protein n=1 Tax=Proteiniphilum acetatigenes TaxID=294710 RepID=UPI000379A70C|nr:hypothetical protein [Proteiniphilum acetatigenes]SFK98782.1 hypothetical protein SAMN05216357_11029 [Porphyromonadaceae bacterium KH3CP3RA]
MKRIVFLFLILFPLIVVSCSKDDGGETLDYVNYSGENEDGVRRMLAFKPDGKCVDHFYVKVDGGSIDYEVRYTIDGDNVTLIQSTGVYASGKFFNNRNTLTMDYGYEDGVWVLSKIN